MSVPATPAGPYASKAVAAVVLAVTGVLVQWLATKGLNLDQEGVTAIVGAVVSFAVYQISNRRKLVGDSEPRGRSSWSNPA